MSNTDLKTPTPPTAAGSCEIIHVPNTLAKKVGPNFKLSGAASIAKAEGALKALASNFGDWLEQEIASLEQIRSTLKQAGMTAEVASLLSIRALDLKGLGATYNHPLVTRIGGSLFKLLDETRASDVPMTLIDAHVDAVRAIVRNQIRDAAHPVGQALVSELEQRVRETAAKTRAAG
jgi:hypothetical protein